MNNYLNGFTISKLTILFLIIILIALLPRISRWLKQLKYEKQLEKSGMREIDRMEGLQFEVFLKVLFKKLGYKAHVTVGSGDYGADLVLQGKNKIVLQAKRYGYKNTVGIKAVQEIFAAQTYYKANESWVVTNSTFTRQAKELAKACNVKLVDRYELAELINKIQPESTAKEIYETVAPSQRVCKKCKASMVVRTNGKGKFYGCTNYPNCTYTKNF
jgi:Restriction endonuclease/Topoisomerase DNA binding C4 zinc finger